MLIIDLKYKHKLILSRSIQILQYVYPGCVNRLGYIR